MAWQDKCANKLVGLDEAIGSIKSGDVVNVAPYSTTPMTLCLALQERGRRGEIRDVHIDHPAAAISWTDPDPVQRCSHLNRGIANIGPGMAGGSFPSIHKT